MYNIDIYDNFLDEEDFKTIVKMTRKPKWVYWKRSNNPYSHIWGMDMDYCKEVNSFLIDKVKQKTGLDFNIMHANVNGQTKDTPATIHNDSGTGATHTVMLFANEYWEPQWGGRFIIWDKVMNSNWDYNAVDPIPNRLVIFPSSLLHVGEPPNAMSNAELRITVASHCTKNN
jgi:Rps23 Pro-64 3,4-dihydroxylase Tpa1-like proline 4-hydroxylase